MRRSIKAIGQAAVKIEAGAERCVNVLLDLIATRVSYVVQEAVVVMKVLTPIHISWPSLILGVQDIFRRYPMTYEGVIPTLCANLEELDEPEAKASLIWIIGEYANKIDNADELLNIFVETFTEESYSVRRFPFSVLDARIIVDLRMRSVRYNCKRLLQSSSFSFSSPTGPRAWSNAFSIRQRRIAIRPMCEIGRISTGVFCQQTPEQQRYRRSCVNFLPPLPLIHYSPLVCRPRTSTADIVTSHNRCPCVTQRTNRRSVQSRKCLSKTSRDIHRPGANRR